MNFKKQLPVLMTIPCAIFDDLTTKEDCVTDVLMFSQNNIFAVGTNYGNIKIFKWEPRKRSKKII